LSRESPLTVSASIQVEGKEEFLSQLHFDSSVSAELVQYTVRQAGTQVFRFRVDRSESCLESTFSELYALDGRDDAGARHDYRGRSNVKVTMDGASLVDEIEVPVASNVEIRASGAALLGKVKAGASDSAGIALVLWTSEFRERPRATVVRHPEPANQACLKTEVGIRHIRLLAGTRWWLGRHGCVPKPGESWVDIHLRNDPESPLSKENRISGNHLVFEHTAGIFEMTCHGRNGVKLSGQSMSAIGCGPHRLKPGMTIQLDARQQVAALRVAVATDTILVLTRADSLANQECWVLVVEQQIATVDSKEQSARRHRDALTLGALGLPPLAHYGGGFWELHTPEDSAAKALAVSRNKPIGPTAMPSTVRGKWIPVAHPEVM